MMRYAWATISLLWLLVSQTLLKLSGIHRASEAFGNVNTILGLGLSSDSDSSYSFLEQAYDAGYLADNAFAFQGVAYESSDPSAQGTAHITLGGFEESDISGDMQYYSNENDSNTATTYGTWMLSLSSMTV